jgi:hypothetical protein
MGTFSRLPKEGLPTMPSCLSLMVGRGAAASPLGRRGGVWWRHIGDHKCAAMLGIIFDDALVKLAELGVDRLLPLNVLSVQPGNQLGIRLLAAVVGMVAPTQVELPTGSLVVTHPPAARLMTIEFLHDLVYASRDRSDNAEFGDIRTES